MKDIFTAFSVETMSTKPGSTGMKYVKDVRQWMTTSSDIVADMRAGLKTISGSGYAPVTEIIKIFGEFVRDEVTVWLDEISAEKELDKSDRLAGSVARWAKKKQPETLQKEIAQLLMVVTKVPTVWVRSAAPVRLELRVMMRKEMKDKYLVFNVDQNLLGGMKLLSEGKVIDASWLSRINKLSQLAA